MISKFMLHLLRAPQHVYGLNPEIWRKASLLYPIIPDRITEKADDSSENYELFSTGRDLITSQKDQQKRRRSAAKECKERSKILLD